MEAFYPVEVVSPPMVLVALLGRADLHAAAGEVLQRRHDREHFINYIGIPDAHGAARLFGERESSCVVLRMAVHRPVHTSFRSRSLARPDSA